MFILVTSHLEALVPTIRSRCAQIYFPKLPTAAIADYLERQSNLKPVQAKELASAANGVIGLGITLATSQDTANAHIELVKLANDIQEAPIFDRLVTAKRLAESKTDLTEFAGVLHQSLLRRLRDDASVQNAVAHRLQVLERFRLAIEAKVVARVAIEQLVLDL